MITYIDSKSGKVIGEYPASKDRAEDEWIPCIERTPTKDGHYLVSFEESHYIDNIYVGLAYWNGSRWQAKSMLGCHYQSRGKEQIMSSIEPCPFCGRKAELQYYEINVPFTFTECGYEICCRHCGIRFNERLNHMPEFDKESDIKKQKLIEKWNRRVSDFVIDAGRR